MKGKSLCNTHSKHWENNATSPSQYITRCSYAPCHKTPPREKIGIWGFWNLRKSFLIHERILHCREQSTHQYCPPPSRAFNYHFFFLVYFQVSPTTYSNPFLTPPGMDLPVSIQGFVSSRVRSYTPRTLCQLLPLCLCCWLQYQYTSQWFYQYISYE